MSESKVRRASPAPKLKSVLTFANIFDVKWSHLSPSIILPKIRKLFKNPTLQPYSSTNSDLDLQPNPFPRSPPSLKPSQHPSDLFKSLLAKTYHTYSRSKKHQLPPKHQYTGQLSQPPLLLQTRPTLLYTATSYL